MENDKNVSIREEVVSAPSIPDAVKTAEGEKMAEAVNSTESAVSQEVLQNLVVEDGSVTYSHENEVVQLNHFTIEILNMPKFFGAEQVKGIFRKEKLKIPAVTKVDTQYFATFVSEEDRQQALEKLKHCRVKGTLLDAKLADEDPLLKKRKADEAKAQKEEKKPRTEVSIADQLVLEYAPYAMKPYDERLDLKSEKMKKALKNLTNKIRDVSRVTSEGEIESFSYVMRQKRQSNSNVICDFSGVKPSPVRENYRNKCDFTIGVNPETKQLTAGFRTSSYKAVPLAVGPISHLTFIPDAMKTAVQLFETHFRNSGRKPFDPKDQSGFWRQLLLRTNLEGQILAIVMLHPQNLTTDDMEQVKMDLRSLIEGTVISSLYFQAFVSKKSNQEPPIHHLAGSTHLLEKLCGLEFAISPLASFPLNTVAAEILYGEIQELALLAQLDSDTDVLDVCCGTGTIGISLAKICRRVYGVEMIPSAVDDAKMNAGNNGISNCVYVTGKAENQLAGLIKQINGRTEKLDSEKRKIVAIVYPPRAGLQPKTVQLLRAAENIEHIIYVSCSPESAMTSFVNLCRPESNTYKGLEFVPVRAVAVDLLPDTPDCELIILFKRPWNY